MCLLRMETVFDSVSAFVQENGDRGDDESLNVENTLWANTVVASGKISTQASHLILAGFLGKNLYFTL